MLRLRFKADLFPFFPPSVELVRPRLLGAARSALASHPLLRLGGWDPMTSAAALLERLRRFLERTARVDVECSANDPRASPGGAHCDPLSLLDGALAHLGALHGLQADADAALHARDAEAEAAMPSPGARGGGGAAALENEDGRGRVHPATMCGVRSFTAPPRSARARATAATACRGRPRPVGRPAARGSRAAAR